MDSFIIALVTEVPMIEANIAGTITSKSPVNSKSKKIEVSGACVVAAKNAPIPTRAKNHGCICKSVIVWIIEPKRAPKTAPINNEGPKIPPTLPEPIVTEVAIIF